MVVAMAMGSNRFGNHQKPLVVRILCGHASVLLRWCPRQDSNLRHRLLQTVVEVAAEKNSTLVLPFPVELLRFLERSTPQGQAEEPADDDVPRAIAAKVADGIGLLRLGEQETG